MNFRFLIMLAGLVAGTSGVSAQEAGRFAMKDIPGALFKSLSVFALRDINLLRIESRPLKGRPWEYAFYLDFDGHLGQEPAAKAVDHLREIATFVKILGSYRQGEAIEGKMRAQKG